MAHVDTFSGPVSETRASPRVNTTAALVLVCLALAFLGDVPLIGFLLGVAGTIALIVGFVTRGTAPA